MLTLDKKHLHSFNYLLQILCVIVCYFFVVSDQIDWKIDSGELAGTQLELRTENKTFQKSTRILQASHNFVSKRNNIL